MSTAILTEICEVTGGLKPHARNVLVAELCVGSSVPHKASNVIPRIVRP